MTKGATAELLERLQAATEGDNELSLAVCRAVVGEDFYRDVSTSLDAAIALVERCLPEANCYGVEKERDQWSGYVSRNFVKDGHWLEEAYHKTAPLALLTALLRAHKRTRTMTDTLYEVESPSHPDIIEKIARAALTGEKK